MAIHVASACARAPSAAYSAVPQKCFAPSPPRAHAMTTCSSPAAGRRSTSAVIVPSTIGRPPTPRPRHRGSRGQPHDLRRRLWRDPGRGVDALAPGQRPRPQAQRVARRAVDAAREAGGEGMVVQPGIRTGDRQGLGMADRGREPGALQGRRRLRRRDHHVAVDELHDASVGGADGHGPVEWGGAQPHRDRGRVGGGPDEGRQVPAGPPAVAGLGRAAEPSGDGEGVAHAADASQGGRAALRWLSGTSVTMGRAVTDRAAVRQAAPPPSGHHRPPTPTHPRAACTTLPAAARNACSPASTRGRAVGACAR